MDTLHKTYMPFFWAQVTEMRVTAGEFSRGNPQPAMQPLAESPGILQDYVINQPGQPQTQPRATIIDLMQSDVNGTI